MELSHRVVYYKNYAFEQRQPPKSYASVKDDWFGARNCPVTWESAPAGRSKSPISSVLEFVEAYQGKFGAYHLINNNCHHFANRLSEFLDNNNYVINDLVNNVVNGANAIGDVANDVKNDVVNGYNSVISKVNCWIPWRC